MLQNTFVQGPSTCENFSQWSDLRAIVDNGGHKSISLHSSHSRLDIRLRKRNPVIICPLI